MRELVVFGIVGVGATLTHYTSALVFVELFAVNLFLANFWAFCIAVSVSYIGHSKLTFRKPMHRAGAIKFGVVSISALGLSQLVLAGLTWLALLDYKLNMLVTVGVIPVYSYILNKFWVYK